MGIVTTGQITIVDTNDAYNIVLTKDTLLIPTNADGTGGTFDASTSTTASVLLGGVDDSENWVFSVATSQITGASSNSNRTYTVTALSGDTGFVTFTATKPGYNVLTKVFSPSKSKQGVASTSYTLTASPDKITNKNGVCTPATVTFSAMSKTGTSPIAAYPCRFKIYKNSVLTYTSASDESSTIVTPSYDTVSIKCEMYQAGGTTTKLDEQSVLVLTDQSQQIVDSLNAGGKVYTQPTNPYPIKPTFSRASVAYTQDGKQVASGIPRMEQGKFGQAITIEEATVNLCKYSQDLSNALWGKSVSGTGVLPVVTANDALAPDGTMTATKVVLDRGAGNSSADYSRLYQTQTGLTAASSYCASFWVKGAVGQQITARQVGGSAYSIAHNCTGDWERVSGVEVAGTTSGTIEFVNRGTFTTGNTSTVWVWGVQLEKKTYATSYMPTTSATASRAAEQCYFPSASIVSAAQGTISMWVYLPAHGASKYIWYCRSGAVSEALDLAVTSTGYLTDNAFTHPTLVPVNTWCHIAYTWDATQTTIYLNGVPAVGAARTRILSGDMYFGSINGGTYSILGLMDDLRTFSTAKTAAEIFAIATSAAPVPRTTETLLLPFDTKDIWVDTSGTNAVIKSFNGIDWVKAATEGEAALASIANITDDNLITPSERAALAKEWKTLYDEKSYNNTQATALGLPTENNNYNSAWSALQSILVAVAIGMPVNFTDANATTWISGTTNLTVNGQALRSAFSSLYLSRQILLNAFAQRAADNVQVGGRNLARKNVAIAQAITGGLSGFGYTSALSYDASASQTPVMVLKQNTQYTISFMARCDSTITLSMDLYPDTLPETSFGLTSTFQKFTWVTSSTHADMLSCVLRFYGPFTTGNKLYVTDIKIEEGNKATSWTPAPEDVAADINASTASALSAVNINVVPPSGGGGGLSMLSNGWIKTAAKNFDGSGTGLLYGMNSGGTPIFNVGDGAHGSATNHISWNGTELEVRGKLNAADILASNFVAGTVNITDASITTLKIGDNAVTIPIGANQPDGSIAIGTTPTTIVSASITIPSGQANTAVMCQAFLVSGSQLVALSSAGYVYLYRDTTLLRQIAIASFLSAPYFYINDKTTLLYKDVPGVGTFTYYLKASATNANTPLASSGSLLLMGAKR